MTMWQEEQLKFSSSSWFDEEKQVDEEGGVLLEHIHMNL